MIWAFVVEFLNSREGIALAALATLLALLIALFQLGLLTRIIRSLRGAGTISIEVAQPLRISNDSHGLLLAPSLSQGAIRYQGGEPLRLGRMSVLMEARYEDETDDPAVGVNQLWFVRLDWNESAQRLPLSGNTQWAYSWTDVTPIGVFQGRDVRDATLRFELAGGDRVVLTNGMSLPLPMVRMVVSPKDWSEPEKALIGRPPCLRIVVHVDSEQGSLDARTAATAFLLVSPQQQVEATP